MRTETIGRFSHDVATGSLGSGTPSDNTSRTEVAPYQPTSGLPPPQDLGATQAAQTWSRIERAHPSVVAKIPSYCTTPEAKLLFIVAHRELSSSTGPLSVELGSSGSIRRTASGAIELLEQGRRTLRLNDHHGDLARLLTGAQAQATQGHGPFDTIGSTDVSTFLDAAVRDFHSNPTFTGGGTAPSKRGDRAFRYATFLQVLATNDPSQRGLECLASAAFHLYKSMGLVPPDLSREDLERRYTVIHGGRAPRGPHLGAQFTRSLRGGPARNPGEQRLDSAATAAFANELRDSDWAKLTGASAGRYTVRSIKTTSELIEHFTAGGAGVRTSWRDNGHYFVLTGASYEKGELKVDQDDSLRSSWGPRSLDNPRPNQTPFNPMLHSQFWTLDRR